jgi:hypothetical protein
MLKKQLVVRKDMDVNEHERLSNITLRHKLKKQLVVRKVKNVNEHMCLSVMLDSLSCSFTSISFLSTRCSFNLCLILIVEVPAMTVNSNKRAVPFL